MSATGHFLRAWRGAGKFSHIAGYVHFCPGCEEEHSITTEGGPPLWTFDGNFAEPTFGPSIRLFLSGDGGHEETICHYFIKRGQIEFCADSRHALKGKTVPLPVWPHAPGTYGGIIE